MLSQPLTQSVESSLVASRGRLVLLCWPFNNSCLLLSEAQIFPKIIKSHLLCRRESPLKIFPEGRIVFPYMFLISMISSQLFSLEKEV